MAVPVLPRDGCRGQYDTREIGLRKRDFSFLGGHNSLGTVLQCREVSQVAVEDFHARNLLTKSCPLGFAYPLLDVDFLVLGRIDREDCELM
jgi:hypothetical protein